MSFILLGNLRFCEYWCDLVRETSQPNAFAPQRKSLSGGRSYPDMKRDEFDFHLFSSQVTFDWFYSASPLPLPLLNASKWRKGPKGENKIVMISLKLSIQHRRVRDIRYIPRALCCCCLRFEEAQTRVHARLFRAGCCLSYFCWNVTKMSLIAVAAALLSCFIPVPSS